jgi:hypothetical protein
MLPIDHQLQKFLNCRKLPMQICGFFEVGLLMTCYGKQIFWDHIGKASAAL